MQTESYKERQIRTIAD